MDNEYAHLGRAELERRLALAEDVCRLYGWTAVREEGEREKAANVLWGRWLDAVGGSGSPAIRPANHPHLSDAAITRLAAERDEVRRRTLRRLGVDA